MKELKFPLLIATVLASFIASAPSISGEEQPHPASDADQLILIATGGSNPQEVAGKPLNIARPNVIDETRLYRMGQRDPAPEAIARDALTDADKAQANEVSIGESQFLLDLKDFHNINRLGFHSYSASGSMIVQVSETPLDLDSRRWRSLSAPTQFRPGRNVEVNFPFTSARIIRIRMETDVPGEISPFTIAGDDTILQLNPLFMQIISEADFSDFPDDQMIPFDFASLTTGAEVTFISSGDPDLAMGVIDDDMNTFFEFDAADPDSILILDLRNRYRVSRFSMVFESGPGTLQVFNLPELPSALESSGAPESGEGQLARLPRNTLDDTMPIFQRIFPEPTDRVQIEFPETELRWLLIRWLPEDDEDAPGVVSARPLRIYEISLLGLVPESLTAVAFIPRAQFLAANPDLAGLMPGGTQLTGTEGMTLTDPPELLPVVNPISR